MPISTFSVSGMTCEHCVRAVKQEVGDISGVTQVEVELGTPSTVTVQSTEPISQQGRLRGRLNVWHAYTRR